MKTARLSAAILATIAAATAPSGAARAAEGETVLLPTFSKVMIVGDELGPKRDGLPRVGDKTGSGVVHSRVVLDDSPAAKAKATETSLLLTYTRSDTQANNAGSYLQGGFAVVKLTDTGAPQLVKQVDLPRLNGEQGFLKPNIQATDDFIVLTGASADNGATNNPQSVVYVYDKNTLERVRIVNSPRNQEKPLNLISQAVADDADANNATQDNNQRGPHSMVRIPGAPNSFLIGQQRNNANAEVLRFTVTKVGGGAEVHVNYLRRVIDKAQHCRPQVTPDGFLTAVEADNQPADIGIQLLKINLQTGAVQKRVDVIKADPGKNRYVAGPMVADMGDKYIAVSYQMSQKIGRNNGNAHTGGANTSHVRLYDKATMEPLGAPLESVAGYARHAVSFGTMWGEGDGVPTFASLSGSSTGTGKGLVQMIPMDMTKNTLGLKDPMKLYVASKYSDVANLAVRGLNNPNDQGRGFLEGVSGVPNPGYGKPNGFMPEVKTFAASAIAGYTNEQTKAIGRRESLWLSLIPTTWKPGIKTAPGEVTDKPGANPDGTGPLPRSGSPATDTSPNAQSPSGPNDGEGEQTEGEGTARGGLGPQASGCSVGAAGSESGAGLVLLAVCGVMAMARRKREEA